MTVCICNYNQCVYVYVCVDKHLLQIDLDVTLLDLIFLKNVLTLYKYNLYM